MSVAAPYFSSPEDPECPQETTTEPEGPMVHIHYTILDYTFETIGKTRDEALIYMCARLAAYYMVLSGFDDGNPESMIEWIHSKHEQIDRMRKELSDIIGNATDDYDISK